MNSRDLYRIEGIVKKIKKLSSTKIIALTEKGISIINLSNYETESTINLPEYFTLMNLKLDEINAYMLCKFECYLDTSEFPEISYSK